MIKTLLLFIIIGYSVYTQDLSVNIAGTWRYSDNTECPDFILFKPDSTYTILNDCGCQNPGLPIVEKGKWIYNINENTIQLTYREYISSNSVFSEYHGKDSELTFYVESISENEMILCFGSNNIDCVNENYIKIFE